MMKLPPYGRDVAKKPRNVFIYAGVSAWRAGKIRAQIVGRNSVLVLPPQEDFRMYHWPVHGVPLLLLWQDGDIAEVRSFAAYLVQEGSPHVVAPHRQDPEGCMFARPRRVAA